MSLNQIEYFLSVAKHLNFTNAAKECHISQSAISQQIENLENSIGVKLFNRNNRKTSLTPAGTVFFKNAVNIMNLYNDAVLKAKQIDNQKKQKISIGYCGPWEKNILPYIVSSYKKINPDITLQFDYIQLNQVASAILNRSIDIAFAAPYHFDVDVRLNIITLAESPINIVVNKDHPFYKRNAVNIEELRSEKFILLDNSKSLGLQKKAKKIWNSLNIDLSHNKILIQNDLDSVILLVKSGLGITVLPRAIQDDLSAYNLDFISIKDNSEKFYVGAAWLKDDLNKKSCLNDFILFLKENINKKDEY